MIRRIRRFLTLPADRRRLFVTALVLVGAVRIGLWLIPFRALRRLVAPRNRYGATRRGSVPEFSKQIVWAVRTAARHVPGATCLTQALAVQRLLQGAGHPADLRIGVAKSDRGVLEAHAWVESRGEVIVGGPDIGRYAQLLVNETWHAQV
jgi:hypothetical protein